MRILEWQRTLSGFDQLHWDHNSCFYYSWAVKIGVLGGGGFEGLFDYWSLIVVEVWVGLNHLLGLVEVRSNWLVLGYLCVENEVCYQLAIAIFSCLVHLLTSTSTIRFYQC